MSELPNQYLRLKQAIEKYPFLTRNILKNLIFKNVQGFRSRCICKIGRRLLIDEVAFLQFIADGKEKK
jgi:hypothetical protein